MTDTHRTARPDRGELQRLNRDRLNVLAAGTYGIADAADYPDKRTLIDAIFGTFPDHDGAGDEADPEPVTAVATVDTEPPYPDALTTALTEPDEPDEDGGAADQTYLDADPAIVAAFGAMDHAALVTWAERHLGALNPGDYDDTGTLRAMLARVATNDPNLARAVIEGDPDNTIQSDAGNADEDADPALVARFASMDRPSLLAWARDHLDVIDMEAWPDDVIRSLLAREVVRNPHIAIIDGHAASPDGEDDTDTGDTIQVAGTVGRDHIAFFEHNDRHPGGDVVIRGTQSARVAPTIDVMRAIRDGRLVIPTGTAE